MYKLCVCVLPNLLAPPQYSFLNFLLVPSHSDPAFHCSIPESVKVAWWEFCGGRCQLVRVLVHNVLTCSQSHGERDCIWEKALSKSRGPCSCAGLQLKLGYSDELLISPVDGKDRRDIHVLGEERMISIKALIRISSTLTYVAKVV